MPETARALSSLVQTDETTVSKLEESHPLSPEQVQHCGSCSKLQKGLLRSLQKGLLRSLHVGCVGSLEFCCDSAQPTRLANQEGATPQQPHDGSKGKSCLVHA